MLTAIGSLHHESLVGIASKEGGVSGGNVVLVDSVKVGLEAIGFVSRVEMDGNASGRHFEVI